MFLLDLVKVIVEFEHLMREMMDKWCGYRIVGDNSAKATLLSSFGFQLKGYKWL